MQDFLKNYFKAVTYIITFIVLSLITTFVTLSILSYNKTVVVPDIRGKNVIEATKVLEEAGLLLKIVDEEHDRFIPPGNIVRQEKEPGTKVKNGRGIRVYLSKGPAISSMPSYESLSLGIVERLIVSSGARIKRKLFIHSDDVMRGRVVAHRPMPGEPGGESVELIVSLGPREVKYKCPDFVNMPEEKAEELALLLGIRLSKEGTGSIVQAQSPYPGTIIKKGDSVDISLHSVQEITDRFSGQ
jgi:beta-lactam-binding protein with PASTA domain